MAVKTNSYPKTTQNWFHVKSEWQKKFSISSIWTLIVRNINSCRFYKVFIKYNVYCGRPYLQWRHSESSSHCGKSQYLAAIQILREIIFGNFLVPQNYRCDRILAASEFWIFGNFREINTLVTYLVILSKFWHKKLPKQHSNWDLVLENLKASFVNQRGWKRQF